MKRSFARDEHGQALIVIALAVVVLLGALALGLDWGYGLTQRRVAQNAADAAALSAARLLAGSAVLAGGEIVFGSSQEQTYCQAKKYAEANRVDFAPAGQTLTFELQYGDSSTPIGWTTSATVADCSSIATSTAVPPTTVWVRATSGASYRSLIASVIGAPTITAQASARARMAGAEMPEGGPVWPMVRHYSPSDFPTSCGVPCDPENLTPVLFWSSQGSQKNMVYGNFKGLVDFSRYSTRMLPTYAGQYIEQWDQSALKPDASVASYDSKTDTWSTSSSSSCTPTWDPAGDQTPSNYDKQCDIPNWVTYPFAGTLSTGTDWSDRPQPANQEAPESIGARTTTRTGACAADELPAGLTAPSCDDQTLGDWVETSYGNLGDNVGPLMMAYIDKWGVETPFSDLLIPGSKSVHYGKAVVMNVYLWDCAETYTGSTGNEWQLVMPKNGSDCSTVENGAGIPTPDRVHLFTLAPFTFYAGLVDQNQIQGFWGGLVVAPTNAGDCVADPTTCGPLTQFSNTAFLVPDDSP